MVMNQKIRILLAWNQLIYSYLLLIVLVLCELLYHSSHQISTFSPFEAQPIQTWQLRQEFMLHLIFCLIWLEPFDSIINRLTSRKIVLLHFYNRTIYAWTTNWKIPNFMLMQHQQQTNTKRHTFQLLLFNFYHEFQIDLCTYSNCM